MDLLVNKNNVLNRDYIPEDLVIVSNPYYSSSVTGSELKVRGFVYEAFNLMKEEAQKHGHELFIDSGYRGYEHQERVLQYYLNEMGEDAYNKVALPGTSEHQTGLAFDCGVVINGEYKEELDDTMEATKWVHENCHHFGFILRYPKDKVAITGYNYEPWHLRFVGKELAELLKTNNLTLEEYHLTKDVSRT